jgi:hypothetical protein
MPQHFPALALAEWVNCAVGILHLGFRAQWRKIPAAKLVFLEKYVETSSNLERQTREIAFWVQNSPTCARTEWTGASRKPDPRRSAPAQNSAN